MNTQLAAKRASSRRWAARNTERVRETRARRAASIEGALRGLCSYKGRSRLDPAALMQMFKAQNGRCAISGVEMTWGYGSGRVTTHVSIDRIKPGGYTIENVQLVCYVVNVMKHNMVHEELVQWCRLIAAQAQSKQ